MSDPHAAKCRLSLAFLVAFAVSWFAPTAAWAHDPHFSGLTVRMEPSGLRGSVAVPLARLKGFATEQAASDAGAVVVGAQILPRVVLHADNRLVALEAAAVEPIPAQKSVMLEVRGEWSRLPTHLTVGQRLIPEDAGSRTLVIVYEHGDLKQQTILDRDHPALVYTVGGEKQSLGAIIRQFVVTGIYHIFTGPDHILFLVGLLLLGGTLKRLLKIVTAFTAAHSITLALAALRIVNPSSSVIEPLIALSIVCVGCDNLVFKRGDRDLRALLAFGFGFIHGFGFAGVLREVGLPREALGWSLVSFNVGVEIGQACIVLAVAPLLMLVAKRYPASEKIIRTVGSGVIIAAGLFWFVQRVLFPESS